MSFIAFDNKRWWDVRNNVDIQVLNKYLIIYYFKYYEIDPQLQSSSLYRKDRVFLEESNYIDL